jgi:hypothetical protein
MKHIKKYNEIKINENFQSGEGMVTVQYYLLNENIPDEELNNAPEKEFIITRQMIIDLIEEKTEWNRDGGDYIDTENIFTDNV